MRNRSVISAIICIALLTVGLQAKVTAKAAPFFIINSPDHPRCWFVSDSFDKLDQVLRWNKHDQSLCLDVTYTLNGEWPLHNDPDLYDQFTVCFPAVRLNAATRELYFRTPSGKEADIGVVQSSVFGHRIELSPNVTVSARRCNGLIDAALVVFPPKAGVAARN